MINQVERSLINARAGALFSQRSIFALPRNNVFDEAKKESGVVTGSAAPLKTPRKWQARCVPQAIYGILRRIRELSRASICTHSRHFCLNTLPDGQNILLIHEWGKERQGGALPFA
jgi:hypothetical protein